MYSILSSAPLFVRPGTSETVPSEADKGGSRAGILADRLQHMADHLDEMAGDVNAPQSHSGGSMAQGVGVAASSGFLMTCLKLHPAYLRTSRTGRESATVPQQCGQYPATPYIAFCDSQTTEAWRTKSENQGVSYVEKSARPTHERSCPDGLGYVRL
jgi:hypothetical protein